MTDKFDLPLRIAILERKVARIQRDKEDRNLFKSGLIAGLIFSVIAFVLILLAITK